MPLPQPRRVLVSHDSAARDGEEMHRGVASSLRVIAPPVLRAYPRVMRTTLLLALALTACGGKLSAGSAADSSEDAAAADGYAEAVATDAVSTDAVVLDAVAADTVVSVDSSTAKDGAATADARLSCDGLMVVGEAKLTESPICTASEPYAGWAEQMLACLVDRCDAYHSQPTWCGTISLTFDAAGTTKDYLESGPGTGGCVKYQGFYRQWPCVALRTVTVTRSCH